jgi:predicted methyltransferase
MGLPAVRHCRFIAVLLTLAAAAASGQSQAGDIYATAVAQAGRSSEDRTRDTTDHPADVLRLSGIKPDMQVVDFLAADGYYSELLSTVVGPKGHVLLLNNPPYDKFVKNAWEKRINDHHLANVEHRTIDLAHIGLADASLDAVVMVKVFHDLYWVAPEFDWPKIDAPAVLDQLARALKPGGIVILVDHSAKAGAGSSLAGELHRIDEAFARQQFESHGFEFVKSSDVLRRPDDARDQLTFKGPMVGKTDRFVYLFRKRRS